MTKNNPGPNSCYEKADGDEPLFTLLGRDVAAAYVVLFWAKMRLLIEGTSDQITEAQACAELMRDWAMKLGKEEKCKLAYDAFRAACVEVAKREIETDANELHNLIALYGIKCDLPDVRTKALEIAKRLAGQG